MTKPGPGERISYRMVERKVGDLWIDPNVQRGLKAGRVKTMAAEFQADALGVLVTSFRSPKRIHIIDGQHRYATCEAVGYAGVIMTQEYHGLAVPEEAALFRLLNTTEKVSRIDQFLISCVAQDAGALNLASMLTETGWQVSPNTREGHLSAIASLERVYALDPEAAKGVLCVITKAWGHRPSAVQGPLLVGLGRMIHKYGIGGRTGIDLDDLGSRLAKLPGGPDALIGNAKGRKLTRTGDLSTEIARLVVELYNQRRRSSALTRWE